MEMVVVEGGPCLEILAQGYYLEIDCDEAVVAFSSVGPLDAESFVVLLEWPHRGRSLRLGWGQYHGLSLCLCLSAIHWAGDQAAGEMMKQWKTIFEG